MTYFTAYVTLQPWKIQAPFPLLTGSNNIQPKSSKSVFHYARSCNEHFGMSKKKKTLFNCKQNILITQNTYLKEDLCQFLNASLFWGIYPGESIF